MNYTSQIATYKALVNLLVGSKNTVNSIEPSDVADIGLELADLLLPILNIINDFAITGGTLNPSNSNGNDLDLYIQGGTKLTFWRKRNGSWVKEAEVDLGIQIVDGNISLQASVNGSVVTVSAGSWGINNVVYSKSTQTQLTLTPGDANYNRIDAVFANTSGGIILSNGLANSNPVPPSKPSNSVIVAYVYVPSIASGDLPYISDSNAPIVVVNGDNVKSKINVLEGNKEIDWQNESAPNDPENRTYAQKHGNSIGRIEGHQDIGSGTMLGYSPNYTYTLNGDGTINLLKITDLFAGTITII
ncbi:MAG: hypothetical protein J7577_00900 [Sphingobacteriaceae bacterium]|nr:hypothetical protein [Sphingobacteriaceae bacterium]